MQEPYINKILAVSKRYMEQDIGKKGVSEIKKRTARLVESTVEETVREFSNIYCGYIKELFQSDRKPTRVDKFISKDSGKVKAVWGGLPINIGIPTIRKRSSNGNFTSLLQRSRVLTMERS